MIRTVPSTAKKESKQFTEQKPRAKTESNSAWLDRAWGDGGQARLLLLGGSDTASRRVRIAQAHARHDLTPSHWSHAAIVLAKTEPFATTSVLEVLLRPPDREAFPPAVNGVSEGSLANYDDKDEWPNVALVRVPVDQEDIATARRKFERMRGSFDALELRVLWLAFVWGVGTTGNPLLGGNGLPGSVFVETVLGACNFELTPSLPTRASCPEAIWQSLTWWDEYHTKRSKEQDVQSPGGVWLVRDRMR